MKTTAPKMIRIQTHLPQPLHQRLVRLAKQQGLTVSDMIRRLLDPALRELERQLEH